jgi:hypothetical protein
MLSKYNFRWLYTSEFIATIDYYARSLCNKILPAFQDKSEDARKVVDDIYSLYSSVADPEWFDPAVAGEHALNAEISFYQMAEGIEQGIVNMFTAGLYHLFEQQLLRLHRQELLFGEDEQNYKLFKLKKVQQRLLQYYKIDIYTFTAWKKLEELLLLANTVKHADGNSCDKLKECRPDLFVSPHVKGDPRSPDIISRIPVYEPLAGDDLYISLEEFMAYVDAVKQFWEELTQAVEQLPN